jgi:hypothetical protein
MIRWASDSLRHVRIASPCDQDWDSMLGDERIRFCAKCQLNVYNLSAMTEDEAQRLLVNREGRLCARFYRRADGTVLTADCPVGWRAIKRRVSSVAVACLSFFLGAISGTIAHRVFVGNSAEPSPEVAPATAEATEDFTLWGGMVVLIPQDVSSLSRREQRTTPRAASRRRSRRVV